MVVYAIGDWLDALVEIVLFSYPIPCDDTMTILIYFGHDNWDTLWIHEILLFWSCYYNNLSGLWLMDILMIGL